VALNKARAGFTFLPYWAKNFVPEGRLTFAEFSIRPLDTFALWSRGNVDPLVQRVISVLKEIKRDLQEHPRQLQDFRFSSCHENGRQLTRLNDLSS
jgi:hypothetical protein